MSRFFEVFYLILALERFDERLLRKILGIVHIAHYPIDLKEDTPEIILNEAFLGLAVIRRNSRVRQTGILSGFTHAPTLPRLTRDHHAF